MEPPASFNTAEDRKPSELGADARVDASGIDHLPHRIGYQMPNRKRVVLVVEDNLLILMGAMRDFG